MVIAISPRFQRFAREPMLRLQALALQNKDRLELAMQLPNAPFLPLLINTDAAKAATPLGTPLPVPAFAYPDDVTQIVARSRSDFHQLIGFSPKGMVLPSGAASRDLLTLIGRLDISWVVGALGAPPIPGAYQSGSLQVWDATPGPPSPAPLPTARRGLSALTGESLADRPSPALGRGGNIEVQVWDERVVGDPVKSLHILEAWAKELDIKGIQPILPSDPGLPTQPLTNKVNWAERSWTSPDWTNWIGNSRKNAAWAWLRKTRAALEDFKNSGLASVKRLDMAFEEMYTAENANYFSGITNDQTPAAEERERDFKATLAAVYRLMEKPPPDDLFSEEAPSPTPTSASAKGGIVEATWETLPDGRGHLSLPDPANDDHGDGTLVYPAGGPTAPGSYDLRSLDVWVASDTLDWGISLGTTPILGNAQATGPLIDVYVDLNGQPNVGTLSLLPGRVLTAASRDAWEYAICLWGNKAQLYQTRGNESYEMVGTFPITIDGDTLHVKMPRSWMRGNPQRWGYQVLMMAYDPKSPANEAHPLMPATNVANPVPVYDLLDPPDLPQAQLLSEVEQGLRGDVPFIRLRANR
jgi:hypothetical protein